MSSGPRSRVPTPCSLARRSPHRLTRRRRSRRSRAWPGCSVAVGIKFCGMTRAADADYGASLGAAYVGVIFAKSPRRVDPAAAAAVLAGVRERASTVGVFGDATVETIGTVASDLRLDVVQLHGDPSPDVVDSMRRRFSGAVWAAV